MNFLQLRDRDVQIYGRGLHRRVAEQLLNEADIDAAVQ
jgi:hypothetical protein